MSSGSICIRRWPSHMTLLLAVLSPSSMWPTTRGRPWFHHEGLRPHTSRLGSIIMTTLPSSRSVTSSSRRLRR
ncbi:hypothetical protein C8Q76DRAFT_720574 [Earliella scabrosa]|nr:hypothetical protein C8Q76DRAFT_720574 [Earliella scabrosa]